MIDKLIEESGAIFLDPANVGSSIRWSVSANRRYPKGKDAYVDIDTDISISDCNRIINWGDYVSEDKSNMIAKVDKAIKELKAYRAALVRAQKLYAKEPRQTDDD